VGLIAGGLALAAAVLGSAQNRDEILQRRQSLMKRIEETSPDKMNVPPTDGKFLMIMAESSRPRNVLEIGSAYGYSALWIGQALERTGGHLWTIEIDAGRARQCRENIREAGLEKVVTCIEGDAFDVIPTLDQSFDMVFLDAWKEEYHSFFKTFFPKVKEGGVILAHNAIRSADDMKPYLDLVNNHPELDTVTVSTTLDDGFALSYRKKKSPSGETKP
jgi:predicted O-methyltransferase YrrM